VTAVLPRGPEAEEEAPPPTGKRRRPRFPAIGWVGLVVVGVFVLLALAAPYVAPYRVT
jgi:hypothetical protein